MEIEYFVISLQCGWRYVTLCNTSITCLKLQKNTIYMMNSKAKKIIPVPTGELMMMRRVFNCSYLTLRRALTYQTNSDLAIRIREFALENYSKRAIIVRKPRTVKIPSANKPSK